jgi:hypothetical protein
VIIKSKRITARGQALKRTLAHVSNENDNDEVVLLRGNVADLEDARADARRFGKQYCARHWTVSPGEEITLEQLDELIERLAAEFGFDAKRIVVWGHTKPRATENGARHFHILAPEIDPISGRVMISSSHDWNRHSKISRVLEVRWGHNIVPAPRMNSIVAALEREGDYTTAAALRGVVPPDHPASFDEADHQRAKRDGIDLPCLREMIADALSLSTSRVEFDAKLAALGLRLRMGAKMDTPIIETTDSVMVGSLARLTRLRKTALLERLQFNATEHSTAKADHSRSHVFVAQAAIGADGAGYLTGAANQPVVRGAAPDGHDDRPVAATGGGHRAGPPQAGESGSAPRRSGRSESDQGRSAWLMLAAGCAQHRDRLLDLLGEARRSALPAFERAVFDLDDLIERETRVHQTAGLSEPVSLSSARRSVTETTERLRTLETQANDIQQRLAAYQPTSIWRRLWQPASDSRETTTLEMRLDNLQRKILTARGHCASAAQVLKIEERKFHLACAQHETALSARQVQADARISTAQAARKFLTTNPRAAFWGAPHLMRIATDIHKARAEWHTSQDSVQNDWDLVPIFDIWGKPYLPPSR